VKSSREVAKRLMVSYWGDGVGETGDFFFDDGPWGGRVGGPVSALEENVQAILCEFGGDGGVVGTMRRLRISLIADDMALRSTGWFLNVFDGLRGTNFPGGGFEKDLFCGR